MPGVLIHFVKKQFSLLVYLYPYIMCEVLIQGLQGQGRAAFAGSASLPTVNSQTGRGSVGIRG